jgi:hypothetical protein
VSLCLAAAGLFVQIAAQSFTLAWTHTIEKTRWEEDWRIEAGHLVLVEARVQGSGAGMDPPEGAVLRDGQYVWRPKLPPLPELILRRARQAGDWTLCATGRCRALREWLGGDSDPVQLRGCHP